MQKRGLFNRGFISLIVTQFFGAANDNILKGVLTFMVISGAGGIWDDKLGSGGQGIVGLCFTLPFILLSGYAGQFADRNSKRRVAMLVKIVEIPIAILAMIGFAAGNLWLTLAAMLFLTCQSAYFGPAKYGMIPELVDSEQLSRANGAINMMTNIAVIIGTVGAGVVADYYYPRVLPASTVATAVTDPQPWLPGVVLLTIAIFGLIAVLFMPRLQPGDRDLKYDWNPFATYIHAIRDMIKGPLLVVALTWGYFYMLAGLALLIIPEYSTVLGVTNQKAAEILGVLGISIGIGSLVAGIISGKRIEPRLVPVGAVGVTLFFMLLGLVKPTMIRVMIFVGGAGFSAGFYIIPLQAMMQKLSPDDERGRFLGTANGISFAFFSIASLLFLAIRGWFGNEPQRMFLVSAGLMLFGAVIFFSRFHKVLLNPERNGQ